MDQVNRNVSTLSPRLCSNNHKNQFHTNYESIMLDNHIIIIIIIMLDKYTLLLLLLFVENVINPIQVHDNMLFKKFPKCQALS